MVKIEQKYVQQYNSKQQQISSQIFRNSIIYFFKYF